MVFHFYNDKVDFGLQKALALKNYYSSSEGELKPQSKDCENGVQYVCDSQTAGVC